MDLSYFEDPVEVLVAKATYNDEGVEISPAVYATQQQRKMRKPGKSLSAVQRVIKKHNANNDKAIRNNVAAYLDSRQWDWLEKWEPWKAKNDTDIAWNAEFAGKVSHTDSVKVIDNPETGEHHFEDQDVLHEARTLEPEPVRPALITVDQWIEANAEYKNASIQHNKLVGVEFEGVMCSATEPDQNGLLSMYPFIKSGQLTPNFKFENGNRLLLDADNIDDLLAVWSPFRESFFE